jgi:hypothetical protein
VGTGQALPSFALGLRHACAQAGTLPGLALVAFALFGVALGVLGVLVTAKVKI